MKSHLRAGAWCRFVGMWSDSYKRRLKRNGGEYVHPCYEYVMRSMRRCLPRRGPTSGWWYAV
jgi:hypothetical protein